jgi:hypothetical protein
MVRVHLLGNNLFRVLQLQLQIKHNVKRVAINWVFGSCLNGVMPATSCTTPGGYQFLANGVTITPGTNFPILVTDANGASFEVTSLAGLSSLHQ